MIAVCTWLWGDKFGLDDVARLFSAVRRNLAQPARLLVISEWNISLDGVECIPIRDLRLTKIKGCYARLRAFDPQWQADYGIADRLATIDLDTVITSSLDPLFDRPEPFVIMQKGNAANPCPFNGALQLMYGATSMSRRRRRRRSTNSPTIKVGSGTSCPTLPAGCVGRAVVSTCFASPDGRKAVTHCPRARAW
jgi:hypothetical protein